MLEILVNNVVIVTWTQNCRINIFTVGTRAFESRVERKILSTVIFGVTLVDRSQSISSRCLYFNFYFRFFPHQMEQSL